MTEDRRTPAIGDSGVVVDVIARKYGHMTVAQLMPDYEIGEAHLVRDADGGVWALYPRAARSAQSDAPWYAHRTVGFDAL